MRYFHGTDYTSGMDIIRNGFHPNTQIWKTSTPNTIYVISEEYDNSGNEYVNVEDLPALRIALEAGQIAAATKNQFDDKIIVFELETDSIHFEHDKTKGAPSDSYCCLANELNDLIKYGDIKMTCHILTEAYVPYLRIFYLINLYEGYYSFEDDMKNIIKHIKNIDTCWFYDDYIGVYSEITTYPVGYISNEQKITDLKTEIKQLKEHMEHCAYGKSDLLHLYSLEQQLQELEETE